MPNEREQYTGLRNNRGAIITPERPAEAGRFFDAMTTEGSGARDGNKSKVPKWNAPEKVPSKDEGSWM